MPPTTKPDRTFWARVTGGIRRLLPRAWRGEAAGADDPGYPVSPMDLYDGMKGIEHSLLTLVAAWRRRRPGPNGQPISQTAPDANVRDLARILERYNPFAQAILTALRSYVLADKGLAVEVEVRGGVKPTGPDQMLLADAQGYLDEFMDRGDWWSRERELYVRCRRDGEGILRYFAAKDGVKVRFVEPEWVVAPDGSAEWTEGVRTDPDDAEALDAVWVQTGASPREGEEVPADEVYFIKCNVDACLKRGLSDFASTASLIIKALDCLSSTIGAEAIRQGITYITQHEHSAPADLDAMLASQDNYLSPTYGPGTPGHGPGPVHAMPQVGEVHLTGTQKLAAVPQGNVGEAVNALNTALLSAAARYHMPLWVISGDASRNNAMDLQAEGPFGRFIADEQAWYSRHVRNALWRVLEIGVDRGELPAAVLEALDLSVTPQRPTEQRDPTKETERNKTLHEAGLMGKKTWSAKEGLDFDAEQDDLKRYGGGPEKEPPPGPGGPPMPPAPPPAPGPAPAVRAEQEEGEANEDADLVDPGVLADLFYGLYGDEAFGILQGLANPEPEPTGEAWDASSHPRGKGGRFIPKGSAEAVAAAQATVNRVLSGDASVEPKEVLDHLSILTVKQIHELAKKHGKTAPKMLRAELVDAVTQIMGGNKEAAAKATPASPEVPGTAAGKKEPWQMSRAEHAASTRPSEPTRQEIAAEQKRLQGQVSTFALSPQQAKDKLNAFKSRHLGDDSMADFYHRKHVEKAVERGEPVSPEVLADYPDLRGKEARALAGPAAPEAPAPKAGPTPAAGPPSVDGLHGEIKGLHARIADPLVTPEDVAAVEAKLDGLSKADLAGLADRLGIPGRRGSRADTLAKIKGRVSGNFAAYRRGLEGGTDATTYLIRQKAARAAQAGGAAADVDAHIDSVVGALRRSPEEFGTLRREFGVPRGAGDGKALGMIRDRLRAMAAQAFEAKKEGGRRG